MDPLQLLSDLEGLRDKIPAWLSDDFENLIAGIRNIYEMTIKFITPSQPVSDGKQNLASHHTTLNDLCAQLEATLTPFQEVYTGSGSDSYHMTATASLQSLQAVRDHFATASQLHDTMAINFDMADQHQIALDALLAGLIVTVGVLVFTLVTAEVLIPAAAIEVVGAGITINALLDALGLAATAVMSLIWAALPEALLAGLLTTGATVLFENLVLHPPTITFPNIMPMTAHGNQKHQWVIDEAQHMVDTGQATDIKDALQKMYDAARRAGDSKKANAIKQTQKDLQTRGSRSSKDTKKPKK